MRSAARHRNMGFHLLLGALLLLLAALLASSARANGVDEGTFENFGIESASVGLSTYKAGAHPDITVALEPKADPNSPVDTNGFHLPYGRLKDVIVDLPPGLLASLAAVDTCSTVQFASAATEGSDGCPFGSQVGLAIAQAYDLFIPFTVSIFNLETSGDEVARLGFYVQGIPVFVSARVRSGSDYGATAEVLGVSSATAVAKVTTTIWGVPGDPIHDTERITPVEAINGKTSSPPRSTGRPPEPFTTNPTSCGEPLEVEIEARSYQEPVAKPSTLTLPLKEITDCGALKFEPSLSLTPTTREAAAPSGADATLEIPQNLEVKGRASAALRDTAVFLPEGLTLAAGAADGLTACSAAQVGYEPVASPAEESPPRAANCPPASKVASAEVESPALTRPLQAAVYLRSPEPGNLYQVWLVTDELGIHVKIPGQIQLDPATGQVTSLFTDTPQVPVKRFSLNFKGGPRGPIATPSACGAYQTHYELTPWSGGEPAIGDAPFTIDRACDTGGFAPKLSAGSQNPIAGAFSTFLTDLTRQSGEQNIAGLALTLPEGVLAKLAGVGLCEGAAAQSGNCPASSQVGTSMVAAGPGPAPLWLPQPGREPVAIYLSGPYKSAPYSLVIKAPAQAGPFDLGTVVVRAAINIDPETALATVTSDPLPQFLEGVPASYRNLHVAVDRPGFTLNPTSCDPSAITGTATAPSGATAALSSRFQVADCSRLPYKPKITMRLFGKTNRGAHPKLRVIFQAREGDANTAKAVAALPRSEFLENEHIRTICTRVQFRAEQCPAGSIYGHVKAWTPLLDEPLEGPVYLRSSNNPLPDFVAAFRGKVSFNLVGRVDSIKGGIRSSFESVPDAPVSKFILTMQGGKKGLLVNSRNLCKSVNRATIKLDGQNGKTADQSPVLQNSCKKKGKGKGKK